MFQIDSVEGKYLEDVRSKDEGVMQMTLSYPENQMKPLCPIGRNKQSPKCKVLKLDNSEQKFKCVRCGDDNKELFLTTMILCPQCYDKLYEH